MSESGTEAAVGLEKTAASVFRCLLFMQRMISQSAIVLRKHGKVWLVSRQLRCQRGDVRSNGRADVMKPPGCCRLRIFGG